MKLLSPSILSLALTSLVAGAFTPVHAKDLSPTARTEVTLTTKPVTVEASAQTPIPVPAASASGTGNKFRFQFGFGITGIPVQEIWVVPSDSGDHLYMGGVGLDFLFRVSPRTTIEVSFSGIGNADGLSAGYYLGSFCLTIGPRINFLTPPKDPRRFHISPYFVAAGYLDVLAGDFSIGSGPILHVATALGGQVGVGVEIRLNSRWAFNADFRGLARWFVDPANSATFMGLRFGVGIAHYW